MHRALEQRFAVHAAVQVVHFPPVVPFSFERTVQPIQEPAHKQHSTNPLERLNSEIERRTKAAGISPGEGAVSRLVGALLLEPHDEWAACRRYMIMESLN
ncbi:hypothetical protein DEW08_03405 [Azospirillum thermophilum]|uniref:Mutator family transposase n=1 Tax=Azospirillum thermophilum TaxID=2202148 RepID=A0A2S2CLP8_9PROT|nr:hypothetical protein DEW08_03405 [Azospirillum thermophilum]